MAAVRILPKQQGGVGMVSKTLYSQAAHGIQEEKVVFTPSTPEVTELKVQQTSVTRTPGQAAA